MKNIIKKIINAETGMTNEELINFCIPIIDILCPINYSPRTKYDNRSFITCFIDFAMSRVSWRQYKGTAEYM